MFIHDIESSNKEEVVERRFGEKGAALHAASNNLTVFARHKVVRGKEDKFEAWVKKINVVLSTNFPGYRGAETVRPTCCDSNEYVSIFRFNNYENLQRWMDSEERMGFLEQTKEFDEGPVETSYHSLEYWFVPEETASSPGPPKSPPSKPKMVVVTFLLIWVQAHFIGPAIGRIPKILPLASEALTIFLIVVLTTYLWMPITTQYLLGWWLFPDPDKSWYFFPRKESTDLEMQLPNSDKSVTVMTHRSSKDDDGFSQVNEPSTRRSNASAAADIEAVVNV